MAPTTDSLLKTLVKGTGLVFIGTIISKVLSYVLRISIGRNLGVDIYGIFSICIMVLGVIAPLATLGLGDSIWRYVSYYRGKKHWGKLQDYLSFVFKFSVFGGIVWGALLLFSSATLATSVFHDHRLVLLLRIFAFVLPLQILNNNFGAIILSFEQVKYNVHHYHIGQNVIKLASFFLLLYLGFTFESVGWAFLIASLYLFFASLYIFYKKIKPSIIATKHQAIDKWELFKFSLPLSLIGVLGLVMGWIDTAMLGILKSTYEVGIYAAAVSMVSLFFFIPALFIPVFVPMINKIYAQKKHHEITVLTKQVIRWIFILNLPLLIIFVLFSRVVMNVFFGTNFLPSAPPLFILSFGFFYFSISMIIPAFIEMLKKTTLKLVNFLIAASIDVVLNLILIPAYGVVGAAVATTISYVIYGILHFAQLYLFFKINPISKDFIATLVAGTLGGGLIYFINPYFGRSFFSLLFMGGFFVFVYCAFIIIFKVPQKEDFMIFNALLAKLKRK